MGEQEGVKRGEGAERYEGEGVGSRRGWGEGGLMYRSGCSWSRYCRMVLLW